MALSTKNKELLLEDIVHIARAAGAEIMQIYAHDFEATPKADGSLVTQADQLAEALITPRLRALLPDAPVVAEEATAAGDVPDTGNLFWLVDPLDGTREFINRNGEFTVNVALIDQGLPVLGVVYAPALDVLYAGGPGIGSWKEHGGQRQPIACREPSTQGYVIVASRSHGDEAALQFFLRGMLRGQTIAEQRSIGSSLKLCLVAAGEADVYPRLGRTMEWDIAAGHAVLLGAGGLLTQLNGSTFSYGKPGFSNPHFAAWGRPCLQAPA